MKPELGKNEMNEKEQTNKRAGEGTTKKTHRNKYVTRSQNVRNSNLHK